jgi:hypothetical protein
MFRHAIATIGLLLSIHFYLLAILGDLSSDADIALFNYPKLVGLLASMSIAGFVTWLVSDYLSDPTNH